MEVWCWFSIFVLFCFALWNDVGHEFIWEVWDFKYLEVCVIYFFRWRAPWHICTRSSRERFFCWYCEF
jgi:hypothetical protein